MDHTYQRTLLVFSDNKSALWAICKGGDRKGSQQTAKAMRLVKDYMGLHLAHGFAVCWVPSHTDKLRFAGSKRGISPMGPTFQGNNRVDKACTESINKQMEGPEEDHHHFVHRSVAIARLTQNMHHKWRRMMLKRSYRGNGLMLPKADFDKIHHSYKKNPILGTHGKSNCDYARLTRVLTNHLPCGAFRKRFNKDGPELCQCGGGLETREHILYECPY